MPPRENHSLLLPLNDVDVKATFSNIIFARRETWLSWCLLNTNKDTGDMDSYREQDRMFTKNAST